MTTIFDAMPVKVLEELERIEIHDTRNQSAGPLCFRPMPRISA